VSPILGIWASQNYSRYSLPTSFESIATATVGAGGASSVTFSSIPSTYTHLQIRGIARDSSTASNGTNFWIRFNGDGTSTGIYTLHYLQGNGSAASSSATTSWNQSPAGFSPYASNTSGIFGATVVDILDYTSTNKNKVVRTFTGYDANGSGFILLESGMRIDTSAVTSIEVAAGNAGFTQYTTFALYGIRGA